MAAVEMAVAVAVLVVLVVMVVVVAAMVVMVEVADAKTHGSTVYSNCDEVVVSWRCRAIVPPLPAAGRLCYGAVAPPRLPCPRDHD